MLLFFEDLGMLVGEKGGKDLLGSSIWSQVGLPTLLFHRERYRVYNSARVTARSRRVRNKDVLVLSPILAAWFGGVR